jgi:hypothetical protein
VTLAAVVAGPGHADLGVHEEIVAERHQRAQAVPPQFAVQDHGARLRRLPHHQDDPHGDAALGEQFKAPGR